MQVKGIKKENYFLVQPGECFSTNNLMEIREAIKEALESGENIIVFDMSSCSEMDSSGIGALVNLHKKFSAKGGKVGILNPSGYVRQILSVANMESFVSVYESEENIK